MVTVQYRANFFDYALASDAEIKGYLNEYYYNILNTTFSNPNPSINFVPTVWPSVRNFANRAVHDQGGGFTLKNIQGIQIHYHMDGFNQQNPLRPEQLTEMGLRFLHIKRDFNDDGRQGQDFVLLENCTKGFHYHPSPSNILKSISNDTNYTILMLVLNYMASNNFYEKRRNQIQRYYKSRDWKGVYQ